jgi:hypothetical protein
MPRYLLWSSLLVLALTPRLRAADASAAGIEFFEKKIRPVLVDRCYCCHSAEAEKMKKLRGGLLLDSREGVHRGGDGGPILDAAHPRASRLLQALRHDGDLKMPPKAQLPDAVIADFVKWVELGAPDPRDGKPTGRREINLEEGRRFWAFQPLARPAPPPVRNEAWPRTPIDRFVLARLEAHQLAPDAPAGRAQLIRRVTYDLLGLPPTPAEVDAFVNDTGPDAYERLVERLLQSERYGERWARHWLDVVRFAESGGYEFDGDRAGAYHYRDFVIRAFNRDMPYDQFVRLQLAGDQLAPGDYLATSATGFVVAGPFPGQTTAKTLEPIRYDHLDDMLCTTGSAFLGLTIGCARCHDHKYDPLPQRDYYRLLAAFARTDSAVLQLDPHPEVYRKEKAEFDKAHAPFLAARGRFDREELPGRFEHWARTEMAGPAAAPWQVLDPVSFTAKVSLKKLADGSLLAAPLPAGARPPKAGDRSETYTLVAHTHQKGITALRLDALADLSLPKSGPGLGADGSFVLTQVQLTATPLDPQGKPKGAPALVKLRPARATFEAPGRPLAAALGGDGAKGWSVAGAAGKDHAAVFETEAPVGFDGGTVLTVTLKFAAPEAALGRARLALTTAPRPVPLSGASALQHAREIRTLLDAEKGQLTDRNREPIVRWYRRFDPRAREVYEALERHAGQEPRPRLVGVFAAASGRGGDVYFLTRGEVERKNGVATPGFIQVLTTGPEQRWASKVGPRVALGDWLTDADGGAGRLLARVLVNRVWQHHFGRGLVGTPNDFGVQGERPTHPELLDWLAGEFIRGGWELKPLHKLILTSAVYQQGSGPNAAGMKADPHDRLLWRYPTRRLEGEAIRDAILAVSGTLDATPYGPGTLDQNSPRRSVYLTVKRSQMVPFLQLFDAPEAVQSMGERPATTAATQALALMNSPFVRQRAEKFAQRIRPKTPEALPQAIDDAYVLALSRRPSVAERERMLGFVRRQTAGSTQNPRALELALADCCQVLLCSNEFIYVD